MYYIYKATNKINGKIYIGQTVDFKRRKAEHLSSKKGVHAKCVFHKAIQKYGKENFIWEIIDKCNTPEEAEYLENKYIVEYNSCVSFENSNGYNIVLRQQTAKNVHNSIKVIAYNLKGEYVGTYLSCGVAARELKCQETNILKCLKGKRKSTGGYQFKKYTSNAPNKIKPYKTNELEAKYRKVYQYDTSFNFIKKYCSMQECCKENNVSANSIRRAMYQKRPCKNYYYSYELL